MMRHYALSAFILICVSFLCGCSKGKKTETVEEDALAKKELQGIWINEDDEDVAFRIKGDTVYFPDTISVPVYFRIERDSFVLYGANKTKYPVIKRTPYLFEFVSQNGEHMRLVKSSDSSYLKLFNKTSIVSVNQNRLIKKDTVVYYNDKKYHCYVQINPTTYKVPKAAYNDDGVEVYTNYYDNIIHFSLFCGAERVYSSNITKDDFSAQVSSQYLRQSVFSDMVYYKIDDEGVHYFAVLGIPNSSSSFMVEMIFSFDGKLVKRIKGD